MTSNADDGRRAGHGTEPGVAEGEHRPSSMDATTTETTGRNTVDSALLDSFRADGATVVTTDPGGSEPTRAEGDRGRSLYDWWSDRDWLYDRVMALTAGMRDETFDALALESGETVLDLACGPGTNFERLREAVGPDGTVVGLDYSSGMVQSARKAVDERGWENVHVVRADAAATCGPDDAFDAVVTTFALHTFPDAAGALENVRDALAPDGRFAVLDSRPLTDGPFRFLNPLYERVIARTVNHQRGVDTLELLEATFETVDVVETWDAGAGYLAVARPTPPE
ncbi:class I SAM-dependent methyltransferase [Halovivax limisalsi]|uniref:class I SAM-dependent methyltransferase n=1 Tax=Halovivax limisalsi TaxID=1453760 RepID=UPI001FFD860A|nr:methyltransferase domain-containing protein [Halovivax limisalsi]